MFDENDCIEGVLCGDLEEGLWKVVRDFCDICFDIVLLVIDDFGIEVCV